MSTWSDPGNSLYWPDSKGFTYQVAGSAATGTDFTVTFVSPTYSTNQLLVLGCDLVCYGANPTQLMVGFFTGAVANLFYYDSQSTGEGNGVRFQWRGQLAVHGSSSVGAHIFTSSGPTTTGVFTVWGLVMPFTW